MTTQDNAGEPITEKGLAELKAELGQLETTARREIAQRILTARGHGDLSENAEYHAAKEDQALLETKISRLRQRLRNAVVVEPELATPSRTTMNVPMPSTTQMISRISTCGFWRRNSTISRTRCMLPRIASRTAVYMALPIGSQTVS